MTAAPNAEETSIPEWVPCLVCRKPLSVHFSMKCPFDSTEFSPQDPKLILSALYEMRRIKAEWSDATKKHVGVLRPADDDLYRRGLERVLERLIDEAGL
jgi:hypothetical protein